MIVSEGKFNVSNQQIENCSCIPPCQRDIYEPQTSNAALSTLSIETILATNTEYIKREREQARDVGYRMRDNRFVGTARQLTQTQNAFIMFMSKAKLRTQNFQGNLIVPVLKTLYELIRMFKDDMNRVLFLGVNRALESIATVFLPNRDSTYFFLERVIRNCKLVSVHVQSLVTDNYLLPGLEELTNQTIHYCQVAHQHLPR